MSEIKFSAYLGQKLKWTADVLEVEFINIVWKHKTRYEYVRKSNSWFVWLTFITNIFFFLSFNRDAELQELSEDGSTLRKRNQTEPDQPTTV